MNQPRPTLASSCARATTAAEARFRIGQPDMASRATRIIALDDRAADLVRGLAGQPWHGGRFLAFEKTQPSAPPNGHAAPAGHPAEEDAILRSADDTPTLLSAELDGADLAVMVATPGTTTEAASVVAGACASRWIMSAGLVVTDSAAADSAAADDSAADDSAADDSAADDKGPPDEGAVADVVAALRPSAMVLVILRSSDDIASVLSALRA